MAAVAFFNQNTTGVKPGCHPAHLMACIEKCLFAG
jgi:hypothetical protein